MKTIKILLLFTSLLFANEIYSTSKVLLYENGELIRVAWYEGNKYQSSSQCLKHTDSDNKRYVRIQQKLNKSTQGSGTVILNNAKCVSRYELDSLVQKALLFNDGISN
jgi:hypothetical protein